ncbi:RNA polymerase Rpc34 subunit-domain-containing protein [Lactarius akahatsu]|uniref:RNA polymerase Rpc34 subunit-domain-containing protein n=1 Tax=Lactarius akahatsu TaxID=416441 RepID=A0AAD4LNF9_9AGAM|nr:RNA polymerase Rpc34 subunit-domain-containing protein [Lactarius akahatsu]
MASSSKSSSLSRKLNSLETRLHQSALQAGRSLSQKEIDALVPDPHARTSAINFLLAAGLLKLMRDANGTLSYRAVQRNELETKKGLSGEENMVLGHIQAAANQGIWTKHLKAKTELHQTVIDRCLKSLVQKQLIKSVKGVKYPTRKIYMMAHLEPSVELTGGPWYTDNELDTEFIKLLCSACLRFVRDRTLPKYKNGDGRSSSTLPLYPVSAGVSYPGAKEVLTFLTKSKITETQFTEEHVEMLLNVLVLDGDIERLPAFGASVWADDDDGDEGSDDSSTTSSMGGDDRIRKKKKRADKRKAFSGGDASGSEDEDRRSRKKSRKKAQPENVTPMKQDDSDGGSHVKRRKKRNVDDDDNSSEDEDVHVPKRVSTASKSTSRSRAKSGRGGNVSGSDSQSDTGSSPEGSRLRKHLKSSSSKRRVRVRSASPVAFSNVLGSAYVYRAVRQERVALGWSEAPCGRCPVFDFCKEGGPVGPSECEYYGEWLKKTVDS